ncbi:universal stress protein [Sphingopyxis sp. SE2]|uniref:universal stress protein n=1 Tax=Sphingopyxis sp. SE2 TaxID=1586240 RepID=UPI0028C290C1|nr:universal stress protein [Sphingopyxis sp. SE2]MDT7531488.1 universal stress protein [Sphingopyxis sp. SE2]
MPTREEVPQSRSHPPRKGTGDRVPSIDWCFGIGQPLEAAIEHLYTADLFITSETTSSLCATVNRIDLAVRSSGPVLRLKAGSTGEELSRVLIAWKDEPAARRAMHASRPLLALANEIFVVGVGDEVASERLEELAIFLGNDERPCRAIHLEKSGANAGFDIRRFAQSEGIELLVSGAKSDLSLRERLFGDVTGKLKSMQSFHSS